MSTEYSNHSLNAEPDPATNKPIKPQVVLAHMDLADPLVAVLDDAVLAARPPARHRNGYSRPNCGPTLGI